MNLGKYMLTLYPFNLFGIPMYDPEEYKESLKQGYIGNFDIKYYEGKNKTKTEE